MGVWGCQRMGGVWRDRESVVPGVGGAATAAAQGQGLLGQLSLFDR